MASTDGLLQNDGDSELSGDGDLTSENAAVTGANPIVALMKSLGSLSNPLSGAVQAGGDAEQSDPVSSLMDFLTQVGGKMRSMVDSDPLASQSAGDISNVVNGASAGSSALGKLMDAIDSLSPSGLANKTLPTIRDTLSPVKDAINDPDATLDPTKQIANILYSLDPNDSSGTVARLGNLFQPVKPGIDQDAMNRKKAAADDETAKASKKISDQVDALRALTGLALASHAKTTDNFAARGDTITQGSDNGNKGQPLDPQSGSFSSSEARVPAGQLGSPEQIARIYRVSPEIAKIISAQSSSKGPEQDKAIQALGGSLPQNTRSKEDSMIKESVSKDGTTINQQALVARMRVAGVSEEEIQRILKQLPK